MKLKVIQENNIIIVTLLSLSEKILSKFSRRRVITLTRADNNYLDIILYSKKYKEGVEVSSYSVCFGIDSVGSSDHFKFSNAIYACAFIERLKNSINIINHATEEEIQAFKFDSRETKIEILE